MTRHTTTPPPSHLVIGPARERRQPTRHAARYAIITAHGLILSLHDEPVPAGQGWGHDRELVALIRRHRIGDTIAWDARGREI